MPVPFIPAPHTWAVGGRIRDTILRADVSDAVAFLSAPPHFTGAQTVTPQTIANAADIRVNLDTEYDDPQNGHEINVANPQNYYAAIPGWYLAEFSAPLNYTGGAGAASAEIAAVVGGAALATWGGQRIPTSGTGGQFAQPAAAKLVQMAATSQFYGAGDYMCGSFNQNSGAGQPLLITASKFPYLKCLWVAANSGTAPLIVPSNDAWPVPPAYTTSAFLNKNIRDTIRFLIYPPIMEAQYNAGTATLASQAAVPAVGTALPLGHVNIDNYAAMNTGTGVWTAPAAGAYYAWGQYASMMNTTSLAIGAGLTVTSGYYNSGATVTLWGGTQAAFAGVSAINCAVVRRRLRLNGGDTVALAGYQHDSAAATASIEGNASNWATRMIMIWRGS
jgi:hypothetical protein